MRVRGWPVGCGASLRAKEVVRAFVFLFLQKMRMLHRQGPQRYWRRMRQSWSYRSSWRRDAGCGSCSNSSSFETAVRR
jgi:hypothetical protein